MVKCYFCGKEEDAFIGVHLIKNDGSIAYYCSSKCRKNSMKLGRDARKVKWTDSYSVNKKKIEERAAAKKAN